MPTIMQALHRGDLSAALATIDSRHAEQARKHLQVEQTLSALRLVVLLRYESSLRIPWDGAYQTPSRYSIRSQ